ncbi:MAG: glycosyltransferase [Gemmatimonadota bacterium]
MPHDTTTSPAPFRRLAVVGAWAPHRSEDAIVRAAKRLGLAAQPFDVLRHHRRFGALALPFLERSIERFDPDFILCTRHAWRLGAARLTRLFRGRRSAFWYFDAHEVPGVVELARLCDVMYTTYAGQREFYRRQGVPLVRFLPQALDRDLERPAPHALPRDRCEVSFVGSGQYPYRWPLLQQVAARFDLQIRGPGWDDAPGTLPVVGGAVYTSRLAEVIAGAAISLGANSVPAQDGEQASASDRMWKVMACGGAYLGPYVTGIESLAIDRVHCRWYRSTDDCLAIIAELLADDGSRRALAARGHEHALAHHTYDARLPLLLGDREFPLESLVQTVT